MKPSATLTRVAPLLNPTKPISFMDDLEAVQPGVTDHAIRRFHSRFAPLFSRKATARFLRDLHYQSNLQDGQATYNWDSHHIQLIVRNGQVVTVLHGREWE